LRLRYFENLFEEEDLEHDTRQTLVDWSFDNFEPTKPLLQNYVYCECASFHPEIVERDKSLLPKRGIDEKMLTLARRCPGMPAVASPAAAGYASTATTTTTWPRG